MWRAMKWSMLSLGVALAIALSGVIGYTLGDSGDGAGTTTVEITDEIGARGATNLSSLTVTVEEAPGQSASFTLILNPHG